MPTLSARDVLLAQIDQAYDHKSWHGTNLRGSLRGLSAEDAAWRPHPERLNIWELVVHAAYWKYAVRRLLMGEPRGSFALEGSDFWTRPEVERPLEGWDADWRADLALLAREHKLLRAAVVDFPTESLETVFPEKKTTPLAVITGIAAHDLYHAGQIQLLKRLRLESR